MNATVRTYLLKHLAPALSQKFNISLVDVKEVINTFDQTAPPKCKRVTKDDLLKEARALGLKVSSKMLKAEIQALLDAKPSPAVAKPAKVSAAKKVHEMSDSESVSTKKVVSVKKAEKVSAKSAAKPAKVSAKKVHEMSDSESESVSPKKVVSVKKAEKTRKVGSLEGKSFTSRQGNAWTFGKLLGTGGFGAVYEAEGNPSLVIKTGSDTLKKGQDSGVFLERNVYLKLKDSEGEDKCPQIVDSGKLPKDVKAEDYFIVLPRFELSLEDMKKAGALTPQEKKQVLNDMMDALKYLSKKGYLHLDIKAENIMKKDGRWFLIDYGMAERFNQKTETTLNPKKANNGTPWFMARDAHSGLMSRKADLESLVYTLVEMEGHELPWCRQKKKEEKDKDYLQYILESKQEFFNIYKDLNLCQYYNTLIEYVDKLEPGTEPKYDALKSVGQTSKKGKNRKLFTEPSGPQEF